MTWLDQTLCDDLRTNIPEILTDWEEISDEEPWLSLPEDDRLDRLPDVVRAFIDAALCAPEVEDAWRVLVEASARHGGDRRRQGCEQELLLTEHYLLRGAIRRFLQRRLAAEAATTALLRLDAAITLATRASLHGYHREELERLGRWPEVLEAIVREAPAPEGLDTPDEGRRDISRT